MKKIVLVIPYIGKFRPDFKFWLKSVKSNPTIDFILLTDNNIIDVPDNVKVIPTTFESLNTQFQKNFDFSLCIAKPYKYCDLRPCYGEVFRDLLEGYDFWGHTDTDIVYGDLRKYLPDDILEKHDKVYGNGHFSLYRNTPEINSIYQKVEVPTYRQVFSFSEGCAFDEYYGVAAYWAEQLPSRFFKAYPFDDIDYELPHFEAHMRRRELKGHTNFMYEYDKGHLYRLSLFDGHISRNEIMYVHLQKRLMNCDILPSDHFMIVPNKFIDFVPSITPRRIIELTQGVPVSKIKIYKNRVENKLRKLFFSTILNGERKPVVTDAIKYYRE